MSETLLRRTFLSGTILFFIILGAMSFDSLSQIVSGRTPPVTAEVAAGKATWQAKNCNDCHTILGIGGYFAPDLTKATERRGAAWIRDWLRSPLAVNSAATMPDQQLSAAQVSDLTAFLGWVSQVNTNNWPPQPILNLGATTLSGEVLFQQKGCIGCHMINGKGATGPGPDLSKIGSQPYDALPNTPEFLAKWLDDPQAQKPGTAMPRIPQTIAERDALVQYLTSLK